MSPKPDYLKVTMTFEVPVSGQTFLDLISSRKGRERLATAARRAVNHSEFTDSVEIYKPEHQPE